MGKSNKRSQPSSSKDSESEPPRIASNVKQNLQFFRLWKEFQKRKSSTPRPSTSYNRKKVEKEDLSEDTELYHDPTTTLTSNSLSSTNQGLEDAVPVLLVDGYNVCGYWPKLKKHFMKGRPDVARQKLIDELRPSSMLRALEDGCPKVWVVTSDQRQQHAADGTLNVFLIPSIGDATSEGHLGAFVWSSKALVSEIKTSQKEVERMLQEQRSTSFQGILLKHNRESEVVDALKDLRNKLSENEAK